MTDTASEQTLHGDANPLGELPNLVSENALLAEINDNIAALRGYFTSGKKEQLVLDLKNHRNALADTIGPSIVKAQYPRYSGTDSARHLMRLMAPLNILAPKWRKQYVRKESAAHYSLGYYDFFDNQSHDGAIAAEHFERFIIGHGDFLRLSQQSAYALEMMIVEILRLKPRVENDFNHPDVTYLCGLPEAYAWVDGVIDGALAEYPELVHPAADERTTQAFYKHLCKNAGLHAFVNSGVYHILDSEFTSEAISTWLEWKKEGLAFTIPSAGEEERRIARCIAALHAVDRSAGGDWRGEVYQNLRPDYLARTAEFVRYLRYAKDEMCKPVSLRLIRRGSNNKALTLYSALLAMADKMYSDDVEKMARAAVRLGEQREIHGELLKYVSNIFGALTCWEGFESDTDAQMLAYCASRKSNWTYRTGFICKLLRLDYAQLQQFHQQVAPILYYEYERLELALSQKLARGEAQ